MKKALKKERKQIQVSSPFFHQKRIFFDEKEKENSEERKQKKKRIEVVAGGEESFEEKWIDTFLNLFMNETYT